MVRKLIQIILIFLVACAAQTEQQQQEQTIEPQPIEIENQTISSPTGEPVVKIVKQTGNENANYGFSRDNTLIEIDSKNNWKYIHQDGKLVEITGPKPVEFFYDKEKLHQIKTQDLTLLFNYDDQERLSYISGGRETIYLSYDTQDQVRTVNRGVAGDTNFNYDAEGRIKEIERGNRITTIYYDDRNRLRQFDGQETRFILGYFRDDKLISLTGNLFGQGIAVSYGPGQPPLEAKIIHGIDEKTFTSSETQTLYKVVDDYLYCKYVRRLPDLLFDGVSFAVFTNYYKGTPTEYFVKHYTCTPYET